MGISINNRLIEGGQHYEKGVARFFCLQPRVGSIFTALIDLTKTR